MIGSGVKIPQSQIDKLKQDDDYIKVPRVKEFVDDLEKNGTTAIPKYLGDDQVKDFAGRAMKTLMGK
jgi:hypothetical protein